MFLAFVKITKVIAELISNLSSYISCLKLLNIQYIKLNLNNNWYITIISVKICSYKSIIFSNSFAIFKCCQTFGSSMKLRSYDISKKFRRYLNILLKGFPPSFTFFTTIVPPRNYSIESYLRNSNKIFNGNVEHRQHMQWITFLQNFTLHYKWFSHKNSDS